MDANLDAITIEILRNKIASLVEEMHYHFYRSGYSTIIRESRDFSCVILDRDGRLVVAPPMFFHAPVYRHLVSRILAVYGAPSLAPPPYPPPLVGEGQGGGLGVGRKRESATATCSFPTTHMKAGCPMFPTWRSWRRFSMAKKLSPSRARSPTRPISAAPSRARPPPTPPRCITKAC